MAEGKIKRNIIKCLFCEDIIESTHVHDYIECKCGTVAVDGGVDYLRRMWPPYTLAEICYEEMSEFHD